jgi:hypothetical protein
MPWEIDYAITTFSQLARSKYYLPENVSIKINTVLNLSGRIIDWESSKLPKNYFIEKYNTLCCMLDGYECVHDIYDGNDLYGHFDFQKTVYKQDCDYFLAICPDIYFSEYTLSYLVQAAMQVHNEYIYITPQICTFWDESWNVLTNQRIGQLPYNVWIDRNIFDVDYYMHNTQESIFLSEVDTPKWAGWFDMYNKKFVDVIGGVLDEWSGYGAWDLYTMTVSNIVKRNGYDFQQYLLNGQIIFPYGHGIRPFKPPHDGFVNYYKSQLTRISTNQRETYNSKIHEYIQNKVQQLLS